MKRRIAIIIALLFLFLFTSCTKYIDTHKSSEQPKSKVGTASANKAIEVPNKEEDLLSLIPKGWHILEKVEGEPVKAVGDLNKDGINDIAVVIEEDKKAENEAPRRALLIAFGNKDNTYTLSTIAENAILKADEGGIWGDPLEGISIDRGSVLIKFYGGSNWRWYRTYRFRFQNNDWYLIGATLGSYFTGTTTIDNADEEDYNLLTGDFIIKKADEKGNMKITKGNRGKRKLLKLKDFIANSDEKKF